MQKEITALDRMVIGSSLHCPPKNAPLEANEYVRLSTRPMGPL